VIVCDFCGKSQWNCETLIAGMEDEKRHVHICGECVDVCNKIIAKQRQKKEEKS